MTDQRKPSMFDVAEFCGVSHQTVSRVINGHPNVSEKTRAKVLKAIEKLGYTQNLSARALATGRSGAIGVLTLDSPLFGPTSMLHSIQVAARARGYRVVLASIAEITNQALAEGILELQNVNVDGIVVIAPRSATTDQPLTIKPRVPVVFREGIDTENYSVVDLDQRRAAIKAVELLTELGHREIAHIAGPKDWLVAERRRDGWLDALKAVKAKPASEVRGDWSPDSGYRAAKTLLGKGGGFTAIFCANDAMAFGALTALRDAGIQVPQQVSVLGFDNAAESAYAVPPLTTVEQDFDEVGRELIEQLLRQVDGEAQNVRKVMLTTKLVERASTAAAPIR
ncbi:MAG: LacI family DNA-binding transcriptional regulator [Actinomycetales bacterium]|nr:LacI family DNA-binding transcriptional regulator [Actinomycetales bacterium]